MQDRGSRAHVATVDESADIAAAAATLRVLLSLEETLATACFGAEVASSNPDACVMPIREPLSGLCPGLPQDAPAGFAAECVDDVQLRRQLWALGVHQQHAGLEDLPPADALDDALSAVVQQHVGKNPNSLLAMHQHRGGSVSFSAIAEGLVQSVGRSCPLDTTQSAIYLFLRFLGTVTMTHRITAPCQEESSPRSGAASSVRLAPPNADATTAWDEAPHRAGAGGAAAASTSSPASSLATASSAATVGPSVDSLGELADAAVCYSVHPQRVPFFAAAGFSLSTLLGECVCIANILHDSAVAPEEGQRNIAPAMLARIAHRNTILATLRYDIAGVAPQVFLDFLRASPRFASPHSGLGALHRGATRILQFLCCQNVVAAALPSTLAAAALHVALQELLRHHQHQHQHQHNKNNTNNNNNNNNSNDSGSEQTGETLTLRASPAMWQFLDTCAALYARYFNGWWARVGAAAFGATQSPQPLTHHHQQQHHHYQQHHQQQQHSGWHR